MNIQVVIIWVVKLCGIAM